MSEAATPAPDRPKFSSQFLGQLARELGKVVVDELRGGVEEFRALGEAEREVVERNVIDLGKLQASKLAGKDVDAEICVVKATLASYGSALASAIARIMRERAVAIGEAALRIGVAAGMALL